MYKIIRSSQSLHALEVLVNEVAAQGYEPAGAPFYNNATGEWVQAVFKQTAPAESGEVRIREHGKRGGK